MLAAIEKFGQVPKPIRDAVVPGFFAEALRTQPELTTSLDQRLAAWLPDGLAGLIAVGRAWVGRPDSLDLLASITCPTTIIAGTADPYRSVAEAETASAQITNARLEVLDGVGHISALERPAQIAELITRTLVN